MIIDGLIETRVQRRVGLDEAIDGLKQYVDHMTDGKVLMAYLRASQGTLR